MGFLTKIFNCGSRLKELADVCSIDYEGKGVFISLSDKGFKGVDRNVIPECQLIIQSQTMIC